MVNTDSGALSLVDGLRGTASAPLRVGNAPSSVAVDGPRGLIFVTSARQPTLTIVDSRKGRVRGTVRLDLVGGALAVDSGRRLLIIAGASRPSVEVFFYQGLQGEQRPRDRRGVARGTTGQQEAAVAARAHLPMEPAPGRVSSTPRTGALSVLRPTGQPSGRRGLVLQDGPSTN